MYRFCTESLLGIQTICNPLCCSHRVGWQGGGREVEISMWALVSTKNIESALILRVLKGSWSWGLSWVLVNLLYSLGLSLSTLFAQLRLNERFSICCKEITTSVLHAAFKQTAMLLYLELDPRNPNKQANIVLSVWKFMRANKCLQPGIWEVSFHWGHTRKSHISWHGRSFGDVVQERWSLEGVEKLSSLWCCCP